MPGLFTLFDGASPPLPRFRAALGAVRAGAGNARIFCFGDSTTAGFSASFPGADMFAQSYPAQLARCLRRNGACRSTPTR
jgi:hypothetical protein